jgi:hypothetical protein
MLTERAEKFSIRFFTRSIYDKLNPFFPVMAVGTKTAGISCTSLWVRPKLPWCPLTYKCGINEHRFICPIVSDDKNCLLQASTHSLVRVQNTENCLVSNLACACRGINAMCLAYVVLPSPQGLDLKYFKFVHRSRRKEVVAQRCVVFKFGLLFVRFPIFKLFWVCHFQIILL